MNVFFKRWATSLAITGGLALLLIVVLGGNSWTLGVPGMILLLSGLVYGLR